MVSQVQVLIKSTKVLLATPQGRRLGYPTHEQVSVEIRVGLPPPSPPSPSPRRLPLLPAPSPSVPPSLPGPSGPGAFTVPQRANTTVAAAHTGVRSESSKRRRAGRSSAHVLHCIPPQSPAQTRQAGRTVTRILTRRCPKIRRSCRPGAGSV